MRLLCFGDSDTYGYDPRGYNGYRYRSEVRWVDRVSRMLGCEIINAGKNGREIPTIEEEVLDFDIMLSTHKPLDLVIVMLGSNDLMYGNSVSSVAQRMEAFLSRIALDRKQIVLIAFPPMKLGAWITDERILQNCVRLGTAYRTVAEKLGVRFIDATGWDIEMEFDGVHYSEKGHQTFAEQLFLSLSRSLEVNT